MDQRIVDAINTLEIYKQMFEDTGFLSKARTLGGAIEDLKVCAYDSHSCVDQGSVTEEDDHQLAEMIFVNDTEPDDEDYGPLIEPVMGPDEMVCNGILQEIVKKTPLFVWYDTCRGAHTVWTAKIDRTFDVVPDYANDGIMLIRLCNDDEFTLTNVAAFADGELTFNDVDYYPNHSVDHFDGEDVLKEIETHRVNFDHCLEDEQ